jgi:pimeloyl-ACP methyl ester carboxylesterase/class 3 adenylate cyclase
MTPETRYAKCGDTSIAFQVTGEGRSDLLFIPGWISHVEHAWEEPSYAPFLRRMTAFSRLITMDRRGTGLSDPVDRLPTLEERMDDARAVLDAAGSERAFVLGLSEGGALAALFAATYPERTAGLILLNTFVYDRHSADHPWAHTQEQVDRFLGALEQGWGRGASIQFFAPNHVEDRGLVERWGRFERRSVSPGGIRKLIAMALDTDARSVLPSIRVPTLIVHRVGDPVVRVENARYMAEHIPGAKLVELPGDEHFPWLGDSGRILDQIELFVTGEVVPQNHDRVLATVLFVDIVNSTELLVRQGDQEWARSLQGFYGVMREHLERFRGVEIDTSGDGFFATFDGPARAVQCACALRDAVTSLGLSIRSGLHTGECERIGDKVGGIAVHVGARICSTATGGEVLVSNTVKELVAGSPLRFTDRGTHSMKGIPTAWQLYAAST